jgi:hypothetical protein
MRHAPLRAAHTPRATVAVVSCQLPAAVSRHAFRAVSAPASMRHAPEHAQRGDCVSCQLSVVSCQLSSPPALLCPLVTLRLLLLRLLLLLPPLSCQSSRFPHGTTPASWRHAPCACSTHAACDCRLSFLRFFSVVSRHAFRAVSPGVFLARRNPGLLARPRHKRSWRLPRCLDAPSASTFPCRREQCERCDSHSVNSATV